MRSFLLIILLTFVSGCSGSSYLKISDSKFRKQVKRVVVIPVYFDSVRGINKYALPRTFDAKDAETLVNLVKKKKSLYEKVAERAFRKYGLDVVLLNEKSINIKKDLRVENTFLTTQPTIYNKKTLIFPMNYKYSLTPEAVARIASEYNADAVYFQYVQLNRYWSQYQRQYGANIITVITVTVPLSSIDYHASLYSSENRILFTTDEPYRYKGASGTPLYNGSDYSCNIFKLEYIKYMGDKKYVAAPFSLETVKKCFNKIDITTVESDMCSKNGILHDFMGEQ